MQCEKVGPMVKRSARTWLASGEWMHTLPLRVHMSTHSSWWVCLRVLTQVFYNNGSDSKWSAGKKSPMRTEKRLNTSALIHSHLCACVWPANSLAKILTGTWTRKDAAVIILCACVCVSVGVCVHAHVAIYDSILKSWNWNKCFITLLRVVFVAECKNNKRQQQ